ncbi:MAG TPA: DUF885 domain-containing protein, partial [Terriglobales bacterium]|nr:DUF885 domain-containing protein [Terriglobales bacterium]
IQLELTLPSVRGRSATALWVLAIFWCTALTGCSVGDINLVLRPGAAAEARNLDAIFDNYFEAYLDLYPTFATEIGDHRYDDQLEIAISSEHISAQRRLFEHTLSRLAAIDRDLLDARRRLFLQVLERNLRLSLEGQKFNAQLLPVRQLASMAVEFPLFGSGTGIQPFRTVADYDNFLKRMEQFETWIDTAIDNLRRGMATGMVQPRIVIERTLPQLESMIVADPKTSLFYQAIRRIPATFTDADRSRLAQAYAATIEQKIAPAYRRLVTFLKNEYLAATRNTIALSELPNGKAWYEYLVKTQTTTDLTPEQIFQLGNTEIARIKNEMEKLREQQRFSGSLAEFSRHLSETSPSGAASHAALIQGYETIRQTVTPQLGKLFGRLSKAPFEIRTIEEFRERSAPSQYWSASPDGSRPGIFYVNAADIEERPRRASEPLFLHEAVPGHHLQISLQQEAGDLPRFQRFAEYTAFVEGWALYAEGLGAELGLYQDPAQHFSRLNSELFRAARLVVDVGLHVKGWSREQAVKFLADIAMSSEAGAAQEVDRYIAVPAQALGYKIGEMRITAIRAKAEKALGARFDIRAFHDELLRDGALPLDILQSKMDRWIERMAR